MANVNLSLRHALLQGLATVSWGVVCEVGESGDTQEAVHFLKCGQTCKCWCQIKPRWNCSVFAWKRSSSWGWLLSRSAQVPRKAFSLKCLVRRLLESRHPIRTVSGCLPSETLKWHFDVVVTRALQWNCCSPSYNRIAFPDGRCAFNSSFCSQRSLPQDISSMHFCWTNKLKVHHLERISD